MTPIQRRIITPQEFIEGILAGERDFSAIRFQRSDRRFDQDAYRELVSYLRHIPPAKQQEDPLILNHAYLSHVRLPGFSTAYLQAQGAGFNYVNFDNAFFVRADFSGARFHRGSARNAHFYDCNFNDARLVKDGLSDAVLRNCTFQGASLRKSSLEDKGGQ